VSKNPFEIWLQIMKGHGVSQKIQDAAVYNTAKRIALSIFGEKITPTLCWRCTTGW